MAIINLTYENVDAIVGQVHQLFNQERNALMEQAIEPPQNVGDDVYALLLPRENNKKILEAMPEWHKNPKKQVYLKVNAQQNGQNIDCGCSPILNLKLTEQWYQLNGSWMNVTAPGADYATWDGNVLRLYLKDTESGLPEGQAGELIKKLYAISKQHVEITEKTEVAVNTMREFLGQHRTLQTALKECPAIMSYIPDWMQHELKRVPPKRTRRPPIPKGEKKEIDMSQLVAQATIAKLNL